MTACKTCRYFQALSDPTMPEADGACRRYAPDPPAFTSLVTSWPMVRYTDWCGEHESSTGASGSSAGLGNAVPELCSFRGGPSGHRSVIWQDNWTWRCDTCGVSDGDSFGAFRSMG
jgi:hypothetical protein